MSREQLAGATKSLKSLLAQLLEREPYTLDIDETIEDKNSHLLVAYLENPQLIVGTATLILLHTPHGRVGYVHDVVVDERWRGRGIALTIMKAIEQKASQLGVTEINLTTNKNNRPHAHSLYQGLGYTLKASGFYIKKLL